MGDLGQPRKSSSKQTTTGKTNMTEEREDKDTKKESEKKIMGKAGQNDDAEPVAVSLHDQSAVNIHITNFTGDMVGARGHNTGYHHGPRPQHASGLQHVNNRNTFKVNNINANTNNGDGNTAGSYGPAPVRHLPQHHRLLDDSRSGDYSRRHSRRSEYPGDHYRGRDRRSQSPEDRHHGYRFRDFSQSHDYHGRDYRGPYNRY
jgi:hypothetical protein